MLLIILSNSFYNSELYPVQKFSGKEVHFFDEIKKNYHELLTGKDLNKDGLYNHIDVSLFNRWTDSDAKIILLILKISGI